MPGSFFTVGSREVYKPIATRQTATIYNQDRRGIAKTKINDAARRHSRFKYPTASSDEDEDLAPTREKRNFVDLTREEKIQDDSDGWDIEEDLIDRMLGWGSTISNRRMKNRLYRRKEKRSHVGAKTTKRKRQRRINEYNVVADTPENTRVVRRGPKLSIVDVCDIYKSRTNQSPPLFMRLARRQSKLVENYGRRRAPSPRMFSFAEEKDQEEVHNAIGDWEAGTIVDGIEQRPWIKSTQAPVISKRTKPFSRRTIDKGPNEPTIRAPFVTLQEYNPPIQTLEDLPTVNKFVSPGAPIIAIVNGAKSCGRVHPHIGTYSIGEVKALLVLGVSLDLRQKGVRVALMI